MLAREFAGWRGLGLFWILVLMVLAAGGGTLAWLGPPERTLLVAAPEAAVPAPPPAAAPPAPPPPAEPVVEAAPPPPAPPPVPDGIPVGPTGPLRPIPASDNALLESGPYGPLPKLGSEGRSSIRTYGRPFDRSEQRPKIGLIIGGLGMNADVTEQVIRRLPGGVTLAFSPYAQKPNRLLDAARAKGMELLLSLPLEPTGYPLNNPGDRALLTGMPAAEIDARLAWLLSRFTGYVGAIGAVGPLRGERFAALSAMLGDLQADLHGRGLLYIDPRPGNRSPERAWGRAIDLVVDEPATRAEIERKLGQLERLAQERGVALGYAGEVSPVLVDRLATWANTLEQRGMVLAPITAMLKRPDSASR
jgi:polysaccharide deacetylase 2 family uncharacterized protein YibQ